jgi:hypothetical protein
MNPLTWWFEYYRGAADTYLIQLERWGVAVIDDWASVPPLLRFEFHLGVPAGLDQSGQARQAPAPLDAAAERFMARLITSPVRSNSAPYYVQK